MREQRRVARHRLLRQHVERRAGERAGVERGERGVDVDDGAARRVDEVSARASSRAKNVGVDHAARLAR